MPNLNFKHYQAVHAFRNHGRLATAAEAIGLTTSAVSYQLSEAERRLGCKLFKRVGRNLVLTTEGEVLASSADAILREARMVEDQLKKKKTHQATVRLGTFAYSSHRWMIPFLASLANELPNIDFEFVTGFHRLPHESLKAAEVDMCIVGGDLGNDEFEAYPLFVDELVAICSNSHRFADRSYLEAYDFQHETFITYSTTSEPGLEDDQFWRPAGCRPYKMLKAGFVDAVVDLVAAGFGVSILSKWAINQHPQRESLTYLPLTRMGLSVRWNCIIRQQHRNAAILLSIINNLQDWCIQMDGQEPSI